MLFICRILIPFYSGSPGYTATLLFLRIFFVLPVPPLQFLRFPLFMFRIVYGATEYIQHAPVVLIPFFQTIEMIQFFWIFSFQIRNTLYSDIVQMALHLIPDSRYLCQVADRCLSIISILTPGCQMFIRHIRSRALFGRHICTGRRGLHIFPEVPGRAYCGCGKKNHCLSFQLNFCRFYMIVRIPIRRR